MGSTEVLDLGKRNKASQTRQVGNKNTRYISERPKSRTEVPRGRESVGSLINAYRAHSGQKEGDLGLDGGEGYTATELDA